MLKINILYNNYCQEKKDIRLFWDSNFNGGEICRYKFMFSVFFFLTVRFSYFISVVLKCIRSYPYVYCAV